MCFLEKSFAISISLTFVLKHPFYSISYGNVYAPNRPQAITIESIMTLSALMSHHHMDLLTYWGQVTHTYAKVQVAINVSSHQRQAVI